MTTQALYNKWRGQAFGEILGQDHITRTLRNQIRSGRVGHAYLFTGLRGTGKTSTARIMAKAVNCTGETDDPPCNQCHMCQTITQGRSLDLIEIDAASNRGIDEIRDLRDRVGFAPHEGRYKVYVIDEVHMLTNEAFNALLKTLEEPPAHVIFVLCTTEPHRLPDTILSRCQRFDFRRGSVDTLIGKLRHICDHESISISDQALDLIARRAAGSFRDGESLLDQLAAYGNNEISAALVQDVLGSVSWSVLAELMEALVTRDAPTALRLINQAIDGGAEPRQFLSEIMENLRALMLLRVGGGENLENLSKDALGEMQRILSSYDVSLGLLVRALRLFGEAGQGLRNATRAQLPLELALVQVVLEEELAAPSVSLAAQAPARSERPASRPAPQPVAPVQPVAQTPIEPATPPVSHQVSPSAPSIREQAPSGDVGEAEPASVVHPEPTPVDALAEPKRALTLDWVQGFWERVMITMNSQNFRVKALLNDAYPIDVRGDNVVLGCKSAFHRDKLAENDKRKLLEDVMQQVLGASVRVELVVQQNPRGAAVQPPPDGDIFDQSPTQPADEDARAELRNHPAVKALERRGGQISKVEIYDDDDDSEYP